MLVERPVLGDVDMALEPTCDRAQTPGVDPVSLRFEKFL
jgi:hypothetical protein